MPSPPHLHSNPPRRRRLIVSVLLVAGLIAVGLRARGHRAEAAVLRADPEVILANARLRETALAAGKPVYIAHCAACHRADGTGDRLLGVPDLTDDDHLYGSGLVAGIEDIARHGIRARDSRGANLATMPAYAQAMPYSGAAIPPQTPAQIEDLTQSLLSFTGRATDPAAARRGQALFRGSAGCWDCHSEDAGGDPAIGAPTLSDGVWLYGDGGHDAIYRSIARGRAGVSPAFGRLLGPLQLRAVAVYVASLAPIRARIR